jgi:hypothetical protein
MITGAVFLLCYPGAPKVEEMTPQHGKDCHNQRPSTADADGREQYKEEDCNRASKGH